MADRTTDTEPRDLQLRAYNWTTDRGAPGREVWHIDAGNEWHTREDAEAAIARHEARIRADERARTERDIAAWVTSEDPANVDVRSSWLALGEPIGSNWIAAVVERSGYPRLATDIGDAALATATPPAAEPATPDPWALPEPLTWGHDRDGWYIVDGDGDALRLQPVRAIRGSLTRRDDAARLIDLLCRRHADEPKGPT